MAALRSAETLPSLFRRRHASAESVAKRTRLLLGRLQRWLAQVHCTAGYADRCAGTAAQVAAHGHTLTREACGRASGLTDPAARTDAEAVTFINSSAVTFLVRQIEGSQRPVVCLRCVARRRWSDKSSY